MKRESLVDFVRGYGERGAEIAVRHRRGYRTETWTYAQIAAAANRVARELEARGIGKGDAVVLWAENSPEWIVAFFGCLLRGAIVVPIDHASTPDFVARVIQECGAKLLFRSRDVPESSTTIPAIEIEALQDLVKQRDDSPYRGVALTRQDALQIIFTSGTTAEPRGVVISHGNVLANIEPLEHEIQKYLRYEKPFHPLRFLNLLPLSHVFGQMLGLFIPPLLAGTVVLTDSLKPSELTDTIRRERVSVLVAVPRVIESLRREILHQEERDGRLAKFNSEFTAANGVHFLRRWWRFRRIHRRLGWKFWAIISGGAALPDDLETFWNRLGYAVIQGYGMTETTSLISLNHPFRSAKGSLGQVFPGMEVRIDENGEILVRGENVATAYRLGGASQALPENDGWFRTGDLAEKGEDGRLYFKGRRKNVIVTPAGMNVHPEDLEKALRAQPGVRDCVVIGIEEDGNAEPCAVLLLNAEPNGAGDTAADENAAAETAVKNANASLAEFQRMRQWFVWPDADFPRTPTHKPLLSRIREVASAKSGTANGGKAAAAATNGALAGLISQITGRAANIANPNASLENDLQMSSLDRVELMDRLEERYQIDLGETKFSDSATVGQLEKLLREPTGTGPQYVYPSWPQSRLMTFFRMAVYYALSWPATYILAAPRIRGREHLRDLRGPVLVISNHVTYLDIAWVLPALPWRLRNRLATAMRGERLAEMRHPPPEMNIFKRLWERMDYFLALGLFNVFPLPQRSGFAKSFSYAGDLIDRGWNVLIFPEGKTTEDGRMAPFRAGIGLLAQKLNVPVVPMRIDHLFEVKQANRIHARPGQVTVTIGEAARFAADQDANEITRELEKRVATLK
jgi:long-chain acyl-CoA synthetase